MAATFHSKDETIPITHHSTCNSKNLTYITLSRGTFRRNWTTTKIVSTNTANQLQAHQICVFHILSIILVYPLRVHYELKKWPNSQWNWSMAQLVENSTGVVERVWFPFKLEFFKAFFRYCPSSVNNCDGLKNHNIYFFYFIIYFISIAWFLNFILQKKSPFSESEIYAMPSLAHYLGAFVCCPFLLSQVWSIWFRPQIGWLVCTIWSGAL